jgi:diguanylate cyclase (GGDEF)-like protein/PAS domain S-box-containing protein
MDINLEGSRDGIEAGNYIYQHWRLPVIFLTAYADEATVSRAAACKPFGYLMKPYLPKELYAVMQIARSRHDTEIALNKSERRLTLALEAADLGIWEWESQADQLQGDEKFHEILGGALFPFSTRLNGMIDRIHPDDREQVMESMRTLGFFNCVFRGMRASGGFAWLEMYGHLSKDGPHKQIVVGAIRDISHRKAVEERLRQASVVFSTIAEGILVLDDTGNIISVNPAFTKLTGYQGDEVHGLCPRDFLFQFVDGEPSYDELSASAEGYWSSEINCQRKDGKIFNALQQICVVRDEAGQSCHFVHSISDLSAIRATERELVHLAYHDSLTKLPNRRLLMDNLKKAMACSDRSGQIGALLFIDMDDFKTLNDSLGHDMGDMLLQQIAERLLACVREGDTVARLGGDEFMVMLENLSTELPAAANLAETVGRKIIAVINQPYKLKANEYRCTPSIGATLFEGNRDNIDELIKQADIAMYQSKKNGRNTLSFFDPQMQRSVNRRAALEADLHKALEQREFCLYFQIQVDAWRHPIGAEVLVRWLHPELGLVSPADFIPLAEETGLILSLGAWVMEAACAQIQAWQQEPATSVLVLAVNVSAKQLRQNRFSEEVRDLIKKYQIPAHLLKIEITESMLLTDIEQIIYTMHELKAIGVQFSLDDFGTGYSSLQYLKRLPLDQLKIDQSFVRDLVYDQNDRAIVRTIITMAQSLNLDVIAEGVETEEQREILQKNGCVHFQGYLFGKPVPIEQLDAFLQ